MEVTEIEPIVLESAIGTVSIPGGKSDFETTVRPVLVKVHTDEGITGIGETFLDDPSGDSSRAAAASMQALGNHLVGKDPREVTERWHELYVHVKRGVKGYRPLSALDEALWDIVGKDAGKPLYQLLGGRSGDLHAYATFPLPKETDDLVEDAAWLDEKGFPMMKIVAGYGVREDRDRISAIAPELPEEFGLAIDANTTYRVPDALAVAETASEYDLEWFEEPIAHTNIEGQAELNRRSSVPISGFQTHHTQYAAVDHLRANALEIYQPAFDLVGGITPANRVATLVEAFGKEYLPHAYGPMVNYAASLHVAAASPACDLIEFAVYSDDVDDPGEYLASPYVANQEDVYVQDNGRIEPPEKPGLGIELDEDTLEEYRVN
jgi:L-alanine-DL-glutamate epimerase-like enolase superfamily enzyme